MSREHPALLTHLNSKKKRSFFDKFILVAAALYPLSTIPQVIEVFQGDTQGISLTTWVGYVIFASLFLSYGLIHKVKPMIIGNSLWLAVDVLVVAGVLAHRF